MLLRVKTCHHAAAFIQCADGVDAAGEADVEVQRSASVRLAITAALQGVFAQAAERVVVAGVKGHHVGAVVKRHRKGALQVGAQRFNLRCQAGLGLGLGPHQLVGKFGQARGLAFFPDDEFMAQHIFPALELAPDVAVRQLQGACGGGY